MRYEASTVLNVELPLPKCIPFPLRPADQSFVERTECKLRWRYLQTHETPARVHKTKRFSVIISD